MVSVFQASARKPPYIFVVGKGADMGVTFVFFRWGLFRLLSVAYIPHL
jgi:hypothetical protein